MKTKITSLLAYDQYFAFIPPHGRTIAAGAYIEIPGEIYSILMNDYPKRGQRWVAALDAAIDRGDIELELIAGDTSTYEDCFSVAAQNITAISGDGATVTVTTAADHGYASGQRVVIAGTGSVNLDGSYIITVTGSDTFTYAKATADSAATGTVTPQSVWENDVQPLTMNDAMCRVAIALAAHLGVPIAELDI